MVEGPPKPIDTQLQEASREGLAGTAPADAYTHPVQRDDVTVPPDGRPMEAQPPWRQDFPIDWPQDDHVARRDFSKFMVLTSAAFAIGQAWIVARRFSRRAERHPPPLRIGSLSELAVGQTLFFDYPGPHDDCILVRLGETELVAYSQKCTHLSCPVLAQPEQGIIHCPCHEGSFDLRTGFPMAGPPPRPLPKILLELRGDEIWATGIELRAG